MNCDRGSRPLDATLLDPEPGRLSTSSFAAKTGVRYREVAAWTNPGASRNFYAKWDRRAVAARLPWPHCLMVCIGASRVRPPN